MHAQTKSLIHFNPLFLKKIKRKEDVIKVIVRSLPANILVKSQDTLAGEISVFFKAD